FLDLFGNSHEFTLFSLENEIVSVFSNYWFVSRYFYYFKSVDFKKFLGVGFGRTGHSRKFLIEAKIILKSNRSISTRFFLYSHPFFGFNGLMKSFRPAPTVLKTAGKFIHNNHFVILDDIILVSFKKSASPHSSFKMMNILDTFFGVNIFHSQQLLGQVNSFIS